MWFLFLLLIIFIMFIVVPVVRVAIMYSRLKKRANDFFRQQTDPKSSRRQPFGNTSTHDYPPQNPRRKKIDASIGEYVDFEELPPKPSDDRPDTCFTPENQIEDAEWTEIK